MSRDMYPPNNRQRRSEDANPITRATGRSLHQLTLQVLGGLLIAASVGAISVWGTSLVMGERLENLADQLRKLSTEVHEIRRDFYRPRYGRDARAPVDVLPAGRP